MAKDQVPENSDDRVQAGTDPAEGWIFVPEPGTLPTEKLPDSEDFERFRMQRANLEGEAEHYFAPGLAPHEPATETAEIALPPAPAPHAYARSGATPSAAPKPRSMQLPPQFSDLSGWDALRDIIAVLAFGSSFTTTYTHAPDALPGWIPALAGGIGIAAILAVYLLRWVPAYMKDPKPRGPEHFSYLGVVRKVGMLPAFAASIGVLGYDLVASIPDLLTPLPEGPRVGVGVSVALLLFGAVMGSERRGFEGYVPGAAAKARAGRWILVLRVLLLVSFALSLVMVVGKAVNGDPAFALVTLSNSLGSLALGLFIANPKLNEQPSWYVFLVGATAAMVVGAAADNSLRLEYAAPGSFSTSYVWLPFAFAAFGLLLSRSYVRSSTHNFKRVDWLMYAARTFEFSRTMHGVAFAAVLVYFAAILVGYDARGGSGLVILQLLLVALLALLSHFGRKALVRKNAVKARGHAVSIGAALTLLGFLGVIVFSVVTGAAAGLTNGGLGLVAGITAALMITVPAPVRDEHGVPDLERTFVEFRARINGAAGATAFLPDVSEARRRTHAFPASLALEENAPAGPDLDPFEES